MVESVKKCLKQIQHLFERHLYRNKKSPKQDLATTFLPPSLKKRLSIFSSLRTLFHKSSQPTWSGNTKNMEETTIKTISHWDLCTYSWTRRLRFGYCSLGVHGPSQLQVLKPKIAGLGRCFSLSFWGIFSGSKCLFSESVSKEKTLHWAKLLTI